MGFYNRLYSFNLLRRLCNFNLFNSLLEFDLYLASIMFKSSLLSFIIDYLLILLGLLLKNKPHGLAYIIKKQMASHLQER